MEDPLAALNEIAQTIFDKKGINVLALDVRGVSSLTDFVVIAEGNVDRHVKAIADAVIEKMRTLGVKPCYVEGLVEGEKILIFFVTAGNRHFIF